MNKEKEQLIKYAIAFAIGAILIWLLLTFAFPTNHKIISSSETCGNGVSTSTPTIEGNNICTRVCVPKPIDCPRQCPPGTHYQCTGTIAMNCGCYPDVPTGGTTVTTDQGGARGCTTNPSVCLSTEYCDTGFNQCKSTTN